MTAIARKLSSIVRLMCHAEANLHEADNAKRMALRICDQIEAGNVDLCVDDDLISLEAEIAMLREALLVSNKARARADRKAAKFEAQLKQADERAQAAEQALRETEARVAVARQAEQLVKPDQSTKVKASAKQETGIRWNASRLGYLHHLRQTGASLRKIAATLSQWFSEAVDVAMVRRQLAM